MATGADPLQQAIALHQAGQLAQAEQLYRRILKAQPRHPDALHLLGLVAHQLGHPEPAIEFIGRAIAVQPRQPSYHNNLGEVYRARGQLDEARRCYTEALRLDPKFVPAHYNLGLSYGTAHPAEAQRHYEQALTLAPGHVLARNNLGNVLRAQGMLSEARDAFRQALAQQPAYLEAMINLGATLTDLGDTADAIQHLEQAVRLNSQSAEAYFNLGSAYNKAKDWGRAMSAFQEALRLKSDFVEARCNLANTLRVAGRKAEAAALYEAGLQAHPGNVELLLNYCSLMQSEGRTEESLALADRAIAAGPPSAQAHFNRGTALRALGRLDEAAAALHEAIRLRPDYSEAFVNLAILYSESSKPDEAVSICEQGLARGLTDAGLYGNMATALHAQARGAEAISCYRKAFELRPESPAAYSNLIYAMNFLPDYDAPTLFEEHLAWARKFAEPLTAATPPLENDRTPDRRLRIGYVSPHFRQHAVNFFTEPILLAHDHEQFEVYCYSSVLRPDDTTARLKGAADVWRDVGELGDEELAEMIRADHVDILVDLSGHMGWNRLVAFARRPAPVQVTYIGYQNTTGMSAMDYRLTDAQADPPGLTDRYYTETLERLPRCFFCYQPSESPDITPLPALERGYVTFGYFNNTAKVIPAAVEAWLEVLRRVPDSRLLMLAHTGGYLEQHLHDLARSKGIDPGRLEIHDRRPRAEYLQLLQQADVSLDPFPFNGHTTTCDALWMGVPVVMLAGETYVSRFGGCALSHLGLERLITPSIDAYIEAAVGLASDLPALDALRQDLRPRMAESALLDFQGFTRNLEAAYRRMWADWCRSGT
ncbi:MAG: tetratricopeptide repeat protein [Planctomycetota bacterium]|nr:MAG: tetratricopeptide repeat protein [Planctomycetota bacterium]